MTHPIKYVQAHLFIVNVVYVADFFVNVLEIIFVQSMYIN